MPLHSCTDTTEATVLSSELGLYLKPSSKVKIGVQIPPLTPGQSLSMWEVMEKLKSAIRPHEFLFLKVVKSYSTHIQLEGELETRSQCEEVINKLKATRGLKLAGFAEWLQVDSVSSTCDHPTTHDWTAFFRDAHNVDEMKPGQRPDTVHLRDLPVRWFPQSCKATAGDKTLKPSEELLQKTFETFGKIRRLEIPSLHVIEPSAFGKISSLHNDLLFEAYVQYENYGGFVSAMDTLRGKKLVFKDAQEKAFAIDLKVDFDRTNYLSDRCIRERMLKMKRTLNKMKNKFASEAAASKNNLSSSDSTEVVNPELTKSNAVIETCVPITSKNSEADEGDLSKLEECKSFEADQKESERLLKELFLLTEAAVRKEDETMEKLHKTEHEKSTLQACDSTNTQDTLDSEAKINKRKLLKQEQLLRERLLKKLHSREAKKKEKHKEKKHSKKKDVLTYRKKEHKRKCLS